MANLPVSSLPSSIILMLILLPLHTQSFIPYSAWNLWDMILPSDSDPFRILKQNPIAVPKTTETLALARADWKETAKEHVISIDIPGMTRENVKIEVEENRVLRVSGERKGEEEVEGENWHRMERISGKFWRQFRLPMTADMEKIEAKLENGVLKIVVPKLGEEKRRGLK